MPLEQVALGPVSIVPQQLRSNNDDQANVEPQPGPSGACELRVEPGNVRSLSTATGPALDANVQRPFEIYIDTDSLD